MLGPLPTLCRFVALPLTQTATFVRTELLPFLHATPPSGADAGMRGETRVASAKGEEGEGGEEGGEEGEEEEEGDVAAAGEEEEEEERRSKSRLAASATVQFPLLLATTKSFVPLLALVCTGSHLPGFWGALVSGQLLRLVGVLPPANPNPNPNPNPTPTPNPNPNPNQACSPQSCCTCFSWVRERCTPS